MKINTEKKLLLFLLILLIVSIHYLFWIKTVAPLPDCDGLFQYYYPVLGYLKTAPRIGNNPFSLIHWFFNGEYSYGPALIAWVVTASGLAGIILAEPYLLNIFCIIPFVLCIFCFRGTKKELLITGFTICFFPLSQLCMKQFSLLGLNVAYTILAILLFRSWLVYKKNHFLICFAICFWFSAILKHFGIILLINFISVYIVWAVMNKCLSWKLLATSLVSLIGAIPFYNPDGLKYYLLKSLAHNSYIATNPYIGGFLFLGSTIFLLSALPVLALFLRAGMQKKKYLPKIFRNGLSFILLSGLLLYIIINSPFSPLQIAIFGYGIFIILLKRYNFSGPRGFMYMYAGLTTIIMLILYHTGIGKISYTIFPSILLFLIQTISETNSGKCKTLLLILMVISANFFPDLDKLKQHLGRHGVAIYTDFFKNHFYNPLGFKNYGFGSFKRTAIDVLSEYQFPREPLFIVENFGAFSAHFVFYPNVLYPFPPMQPMEWTISAELYKTIYQGYIKGKAQFFDQLFHNGDIPVIIYSEYQHPGDRLYIPEELDSFINQDNFSIDSTDNDLFAFSLNQKIIEYFKKTGRLSSDYNCLSLPEKKPFAKLCIDKKLHKKEFNAPDYGKQRLNEIIATINQS